MDPREDLASGYRGVSALPASAHASVAAGPGVAAGSQWGPPKKQLTSTKLLGCSAKALKDLDPIAHLQCHLKKIFFLPHPVVLRTSLDLLPSGVTLLAVFWAVFFNLFFFFFHEKIIMRHTTIRKC